MSNFEKTIEKDIEERETVLHETERILFTKRYNLSKKHLGIFSVQSITMIYSILEGFIQNSFNLYINEINIQEIEPNSVKDELFIYHIEKSFKQFNEYPQKHNKKITFINKLNEIFFLLKY